MTTKKEYAYDFVEHDNDGIQCVTVSVTIRASSNERN